MRCQASIPVRMLWLMRMSLGTGQTWGEKRSVLIFERATPTFCFSILIKFFRIVSSMLNPNFRGFRSLPSFFFSLSLSLSFHLCAKSCLWNIYIYTYIYIYMYRYPLMHTCINIYIYSNIYIYITYILLLSFSIEFDSSSAGLRGCYGSCAVAAVAAVAAVCRLWRLCWDGFAVTMRTVSCQCVEGATPTFCFSILGPENVPGSICVFAAAFSPY